MIFAIKSVMLSIAITRFSAIARSVMIFAEKQTYVQNSALQGFSAIARSVMIFAGNHGFSLG